MTNPGARQRGMTLIEVLAALAIGAVLLVGLASLVERSLDDMKGQQAAYYQAQVVDAARRYLDTNAAAVATLTPAAANVATITLEQLRTGKFLPASFADTNPYRQGTCLLVRRPDPINYAGQFDALIVTTGGDRIGEKDLPSVAMLAGSGGGYVSTVTPGVARGASWQMPTDAFRNVTCPGAANAALRGPAHDGGHLVSSLFYDGAAQQAADFLYRRDVAGHPEATTMGAPIRFAGDGVVNPGDSCIVGTVAAHGLAIDRTTRAVLTCDKDGEWSLPPPWRAPVNTHAALLALADPQPGDVRMVTALGRAFTYSAGAWVALAVDQDGNFTVPLAATVGKLLAQQEVRSDGTVYAKGHITTEQDLYVNQNAFVDGKFNGKGDAEIAGDVLVKRGVAAAGFDAEMWISTPSVEIGDDKRVPDDACNYWEYSDYAKALVNVYPRGTIVTDPQKRLMICGPTDKFVYVRAP